jgi:hypothetical protein
LSGDRPIDGEFAVRSNPGFLTSLTAVFLTAAGCGGGDLVLPGDAGPPADLRLVSGDDQSAAAGAELPDPLRVRLVDEQGVGVSGTVSWVVGMGGGSVTPGSVETGADGLAEARWTLGPSPGANTVSAVVSGLPVVTFSASATGNGGGGGGDLPPHHLVFQVEPSDAVQGERITPPVIVAVVDSDGAVVPEFKFKIALELAQGGGKLEGRREADTKDGLAVFDDLKINDPGEGFVLRALAPDDAYLGTVESRAFRVEED